MRKSMLANLALMSAAMSFGIGDSLHEEESRQIRLEDLNEEQLKIWHENQRLKRREVAIKKGMKEYFIEVNDQKFYYLAMNDKNALRKARNLLLKVMAWAGKEGIEYPTFSVPKGTNIAGVRKAYVTGCV